MQTRLEHPLKPIPEHGPIVEDAAGPLRPRRVAALQRLVHEPRNVLPRVGPVVGEQLCKADTELVHVHLLDQPPGH